MCRLALNKIGLIVSSEAIIDEDEFPTEILSVSSSVKSQCPSDFNAKTEVSMIAFNSYFVAYGTVEVDFDQFSKMIDYSPVNRNQLYFLLPSTFIMIVEIDEDV